MLSKFTIEYGLVSHHVEKEAFIVLTIRSRPRSFSCTCLRSARAFMRSNTRVDLPRAQFDQMLKGRKRAACFERLGRALGIDAAEVNHRFGFPA